MIVKNEEHIITECLESMYKYIDRYDITDTGSTDNTKEVITKFFEEKGIPGTVHEHEWDGFGKSRTQSFRNAEKSGADYAWVIDADDMLVGEFNTEIFETRLDAYSIRIKRGDFTWWRNQIFKLDGNWEYVGVLHEYAHCPAKEKDGSIQQGKCAFEGYHIEARTLGGARNKDVDPIEKYAKDAEVFLSALTNEDDPAYEPENQRYMFYLAQSYFDSRQFEKSKHWYMQRAAKGGWEEEVFYSMYRVAICSSIMEEPWSETVQFFLQAWNYRPNRAEPLYQIGRIYRLMGQPRLGYLFSKQAKDIPFPEQDILFLANEIYEWQIDDEIAASAFYVNKWEEGYQACVKLLQEGKMPEGERGRIEENLKQYQAKMSEIQQQMQQMQQQQMAMQQQMHEKAQQAKAEEKAKRKKNVESRKKQFKKRKKQKA
jgi:glycosyltransferase involved in cell wall biosynthesis